MNRLARALPALALAAACASPAPPKPIAAPAITTAAPITPRVFRYDVTSTREGDSLAVDAVLFAPSGGDFSLERGAPFASAMEVSTGGAFQALPAHRDGDDTVFRIPPCPLDGCRIRYRFALAEAARRTGDIGCADTVSGGILTSPSAWLLHPVDADAGQPFELRVVTPPGTTFVSGLLPAGDGPFALPPAVYRADVADLANPAWAAIGSLHLLRVIVGAQTIDAAVLPGPLAAQDDMLRAWIDDAARAVQDYYGRASLRRVQVVIVPGRATGMSFGRTLGNGGATIIAHVGAGSALADLTSGWELIHELLHVSFPKLSREHAWLEEGMATYVEPLLRARRGTITAAEAFARFQQRMPFGLPVAGDQGLDHTHTWGRTYWGGAIFCLLADIEIRERTGGRRSLDDALRAVLAQGGNVAERWEIERVLAVGDEATGVPVLQKLYAQMKDAPAPVDLVALWRRLGVVPKLDGVTFDDRAELAWIRRAMVAGR
ncbi:Hypothetical protein A7982_10043 [Minicystis rosea]|nr:Hypothetical protein A7982_10043 [Minicystis rosea]